ncbi:site-2 protease family protein [Halobium salinum]|uniref:Site-2 protease family protein n=1 Tax=Halobium salinum TaxID=1364940 RepID=A0ABD5PF61_9EURY|nr:site-2 protease family protein [Halobium salinum]
MSDDSRSAPGDDVRSVGGAGRDAKTGRDAECGSDRLPWVRASATTLYLRTTAVERRGAATASAAWDRWHDLAVRLLLLAQVVALGGTGLLAWRAVGLRGRSTPALADLIAPETLAGLPLVAVAPFVVAALLVATVVHEGGHALACHRGGVRVREAGVALFLGVLPLAAYVLPDGLAEASDRVRLRVLAAGVANNFAVALAAGLVLLSPLTAAPTEVYHTYFGWTLAEIPESVTVVAVADLDALTNLAFWTALLNAKLGLLNALPLAGLDGGRALSILLGRAEARLGLPVYTRLNGALVSLVGAVSLWLLLLTVVGPFLP